MEKETYSNIFIEIYFDLHLFCLRGAHGNMDDYIQ